MKRKGYRFVLLFALAMFVFVPQVLANDANGVTTSDIITLVEKFESEGQLANESVVRMLTMHLTAVKHYEQQGLKDKVIEHMNSFKVLMDHQLANELIGEQAYDALMENTNALIGWQNPLTIVQDGEAKAVVIAPSDTASTNTPGWTIWSNYGGTSFKRSEDFAHSGDSSLKR